jgi:hypothetical protein
MMNEITRKVFFLPPGHKGQEKILVHFAPLWDNKLSTFDTRLRTAALFSYFPQRRKDRKEKIMARSGGLCALCALVGALFS